MKEPAPGFVQEINQEWNRPGTFGGRVETDHLLSNFALDLPCVGSLNTWWSSLLSPEEPHTDMGGWQG